MTANPSFNYFQQTVAPGTFNIHSTGLVQGMAVDDPSARAWLAGGVLSQNETLPMIGGVGINDVTIPLVGANAPDPSLGNIVSRANNISSSGAPGCLTGFSVFNQAHSAVITTSSGVPLIGSGMMVAFYRLKTNARIVVGISPSLITTAPGQSVNQAVSWDFINQQLMPYIPAYSSVAPTAVTYTAATGVMQLTFAAAPFGASYNTLGSVISVSGITGTGADVPKLNGAFPITAIGTSGTVISVQAAPNLAASALSGGTLAGGGGALPCNVLEVLSYNCMTITQDPVTGLAKWNYSGPAAVIQI